jgi:hypothetical protein
MNEPVNAGLRECLDVIAGYPASMSFVPGAEALTIAAICGTTSG